MAADVSANSEAINSCCAAWKQKYLKLEKRRNALREAVQVLNQQVEKVLADNSNLKKAYAEERARADIEKDEKAKESAAKESLESKISGLKSEIYSLKQRGNADAQDKSEANLLKAQVSDCEKEINDLKELIEREKKRTDSESKNAEAEKKKASEARKAAKAEKSKADEERKKAENYRFQVEELKKEAHKANSNFASETLKLVEANKKLEAEKQKVVKERECANSERAKAEEQRKFVEANMKKAMEEKRRSEGLSLELVESRKRIDELHKEINEIRCSRGLHEAELVESRKKIDELHKEINEIRCSRGLHEAPSGQPDNSRNGVEEVNKRYEIEKQKAIKEKKRAESEMVKAEKQKKFVEENWKKAMEEKSRADHLSRQLDEAKKKIEELSSRKLIEASVVEPGKAMGAESVKMKHLKKQFRFEKMQKKHAKEVVKLEKSRNSILQHELSRMKVEFDQFSQRLGMLNKAFSHSAEGIADPRKINFRSGIKPSYPVLDAFDPFKEGVQHTAPFLPLSGGNCTDSISGIDSILESPVRGSNRKMLQSSAINSSTASFSDRQLVGSQEKGAFALTTSEKLVEENVQPTISNLSAEVTKINCNENVAVVAENSVRSPVRNDGVGRVNEKSRKRKRILHAVESIESLYFEGKKLHLQVEENLSVLHCLLNKQIGKPSKEGKYLLPGLQGNSYEKHQRVYEMGNEGVEEKLMMQNSADSKEQNKADKFENEVCGFAKVSRQVSKNANEVIEISQAIREGTSDSVRSDFETMPSFDEVTDGNYMKLLDLDDAADEEVYRMAIKMPLSPTLPEIKVQGVETSNVEINSNNLRVDDSGIFNNPLLHKNGSTTESFDLLGKNGNGSGNSIAMRKACGVQDSGAEVMSDAPNSRNEVAMFALGSELGYAGEDILKCYIVFSNINDSSSSISRIYSASRTCITQCSLATHADWGVREILLALKTEEKLFPKEKVCVFFSLLLLNFSTVALSKFGSLNWMSNPCLDSFAQHMCSVMSDEEGRSIFAEFGCLDELLSLIEDFLINRRVVVCKDASSKTLVESQSMVNIQLDGVHISSRSASADELVAGSIVLASICAAFDHIGFISEISYNIMHISRSDQSLVLTILHVFSYLGGEKFFNFGNYSLVTVMKSIVTYLEGVSLSDSTGSCIPSASNSRTTVCPCVKCPFSDDAVSVDTAASLLLEQLQSNALLGAGSSNSNSCILFNNYKAEQIADHDLCGLGVHCDVSCCLNKFAMRAIQSDSSSNFTLCDLSDLLSLVELVAIYMSWEWTSAKVVPQLLEVLNSCIAETLIAGIVVLLGQLGRFGVDALGYEDKGVEILRCELSAFLCQDSAISAGLPTQIAIVTALLNLMSSDFETVVKSNVESGPAQSIRKWFSLLPKKQQHLSFGLLQTAGVNKDLKYRVAKLDVNSE